MQYFCFCVSGCVTERESNRGYEGRAEKDVFRVRFRDLRYSKPPEIC